MLTKNLKEFGKQHNWYKTKNSVFGAYQGYVINIYQSDLTSSPQSKTIICKFDPIEEERRLNIQQEIEKHKKQYGYKQFEVSEKFVAVVLFENWRRTKNEKITDVLNFIIETIKANDVSPIDDNILSNYQAYNLSGEGVLLDHAEYSRINQEFNRHNSKESLERVSYMNGFLGALLFTVPVIILWVLIAVFFNYLIAAFGIFIAVAASYGYEQFKGKLGGGTKIILIITTLLAIVIANIISTYIDLSYLELGYSQTMELMFTNPEIRSVLLSNLGLSAVFGAIGVWWIISSVETKRHFIEKAEKII